MNRKGRDGGRSVRIPIRNEDDLVILRAMKLSEIIIKSFLRRKTCPLLRVFQTALLSGQMIGSPKHCAF